MVYSNNFFARQCIEIAGDVLGHFCWSVDIFNDVCRWIHKRARKECKHNSALSSLGIN